MVFMYPCSGRAQDMSVKGDAHRVRRIKLP